MSLIMEWSELIMFTIGFACGFVVVFLILIGLALFHGNDKDEYWDQ